jgi:muramoyltetrapeptide carboxypeptidase
MTEKELQALSMNPRIQLPPPVLPGDRVGVAALSGPVDPDRLASGMEALRRLGFEVVPGANLARREGILAGTDDERLEAFHRLAADPSIKAILFARGGWGALRILDRIDWALLARHPRVYMGYSDLTPFLLQVVHRLGLVAFHGPMVAADLARGLTAQEETSFLDALGGRYPAVLPLAPAAEWERPAVARGPLLGGCLSLLVAVLGTPHAVPLEGAILFWEDVAEPLYRVDRMLTHLRLSGNLQGISGMLTGHLPWEEMEGHSRDRWRELATLSLGDFPWPVATGLAAGHTAPNLALPLGFPARLDPALGVVVGEE